MYIYYFSFAINFMCIYFHSNVRIFIIIQTSLYLHQTIPPLPHHTGVASPHHVHALRSSKQTHLLDIQLHLLGHHDLLGHHFTTSKITSQPRRSHHNLEDKGSQIFDVHHFHPGRPIILRGDGQL